MISKTQVLIIGAGPTGLSMAAQLLRYNIDFIILEKNEKTTLLSKAVVVQARTLEIFEELGLAEKAVSEGRITTGMNLFYKGKRKAAVNISGLGEGFTRFPFALSLEQSKTEKLLVDHLYENKKEILWKSEFTHFEQSGNGITAYYKDSQGGESIIQAEYLTGCDGAGSLIRHEIGSAFKGDTVPKLFYVADVKINSTVICKDELFMFMIKKGFILFFPMEGTGHYRIVGILPDEGEAKAEIQFTDIQQSIKDQVSVPLNFENVFWFSTYKVHSRKADLFQNKKCFIAGDAAHIHTPAGGQGMNTGIQDAYNLAWKLALVLRGQARAEILETYSQERMENARHLLESIDRIFDIMSGTNAFWNFIRLNFLSKFLGVLTTSAFIRKRIFPLISQTGITYHHSDLVVKSSVGKVKAGVRMPYFVLADGRPVSALTSEPVFKILFFGSEMKRPDELSGLKFQTVIHLIEEIPKHLFGIETGFIIIMRPDNHISYIGKDFKAAFGLLNKISV